VLNQRNISPSKFFIERLLRIVPLYWVLTLAFLVLFMIAPSAFHSDASAIFTHAIISMCFISQAWLGKLPLLFDGWSLEYEMFFYALLSMGLFFTRKYQTYLFVVVGLVLTSLWFKIDLIVYDFILGMAVGCFICHLNFRQPFPLFFLIIGIGLFFSTLGNNLLLDWTESRVIRAGIPSLLIVYGLTGIKQMNSGLSTMLGDASYSIYLIQVFTIPAFYKFILFISFSNINADLLALVCLGVTTGVGLISYWLLEKRVIGSVRRVFSLK
jgi:peptidoglycan/LPS O-acetylase OafA/YrhL